MSQIGLAPKVGGFSHLSLPCRDLSEAKEFFTEVLGAEVILERRDSPFVEVVLGGVIIGLSQQPGGWTAAEAEFPHYAFYIDAANLLPLKERLESFAIPTHPPYTRNRKEALMYFRDPSGNLLEFYCSEGFKGVENLPIARAVGGTYTVDFKALNYTYWRRPSLTKGADSQSATT
ncbi:MAG TPA: VOC family protein [Candidatus Binataceae bacterium]|nr:VOC family protein [Candidatus Binataceae bacterium]